MAVMDIQPFRIEVPEEALEDLRTRLARTRWPSETLVDTTGQKSVGVNKELEGFLHLQVDFELNGEYLSGSSMSLGN